MSDSSHASGGHCCPYGNPRCGSWRRLTADGSPRWLCSRCREEAAVGVEPSHVLGGTTRGGSFLERIGIRRVALIATTLVVAAVGTIDRQPDVQAADKGCQGVSAGLFDFHAALKRGFNHGRWRDPTPLRQGDRHQLGRIYRCAAPEARATMRRMRGKAKRRFHAHFRDLISPPGKAYLDRLASCETRGYSRKASYRAVSPGGTYRGRYQFDGQTWESVGGRGDPAAVIRLRRLLENRTIAQRSSIATAAPSPGRGADERERHSYA